MVYDIGDDYLSRLIYGGELLHLVIHGNRQGIISTTIWSHNQIHVVLMTEHYERLWYVAARHANRISNSLVLLVLQNLCRRKEKILVLIDWQKACRRGKVGRVEKWLRERRVTECDNARLRIDTNGMKI